MISEATRRRIKLSVVVLSGDEIGRQKIDFYLSHGFKVVSDEDDCILHADGWM
jgi:hypothetical protein